MCKRVVGICDEVAYVVNVINYFSKQNNKFKLVAFTSIKAICDYIKSSEIDVLLINEFIDKDDVLLKTLEDSDTTIYELSETSQNNTDKAIFKYQSMDKLINSIEVLVKPKKVNINNIINNVYAVYSPIGRSGKTTFAKALCRTDLVRGSLYISMEEFVGVTGSNVADIMYHIKSRNKDIVTIIKQSVIRENDIDFLYSISNYIDMRELDYDDINWLVDTINDSMSYSTIVFDIGSGSLSDLKIFNLFNFVFMPILSGENSLNKINSFFKSIKGCSINSSRFIKISVSDMDYMSNQMFVYVEKVLKEANNR